MLKLKDLTIKSAVIQSPMAGCTDLAYRLLSREYGMEFCFLEMVSAEGLVRNNANTEELMKTDPADRPLGAQIVGWRPEAMAEAGARIEDLGYGLLDINFGCPVPKIAGRGAGSALLACPGPAREIFRAVRKRVKKIPVTVKMRLGVADPSGTEAANIAKIAEEEGLDMVTVHGRTRVQGYSGTANYESIKRVKDAVKRIPVLGNGDITSPEDAKRMLEITGCDGMMIGRGALGNPWLFKRIEKYLAGEDPGPEPGFEDKKAALLKHLELELSHRDEHTVVCQMRRIACWYFKDLPGVAAFRGRINTTKTADELRRLIVDFRPTA